MILDILYRDEYYIAINKPAGLLVHRTKIAADVEVFALQLLRNQIKQRVYPVHRLDRPTSGVLIFGLDKAAASSLSELFRDRKVKKQYLAIVRGYLEAEAIIDYPLKSENATDPKEATTHYQRLATTEIPTAVGRYSTARYSLVHAFPETGRMHQIRKHFAHLRHPIIGDGRYGDIHHNRQFREKYELKELMLLAQKLSFVHPHTQKEIQIEAPLSPKMQAAMKILGWQQLSYS